MAFVSREQINLDLDIVAFHENFISVDKMTKTWRLNISWSFYIRAQKN